MSDHSKDGDNELVLDWDDAVESFQLDLEGSARAESAPFPQRAAVEEPARASQERDNGQRDNEQRDNEGATLPPGFTPPPSEAPPRTTSDSDPFAIGALDSLLPPGASRPTPTLRPSFASHNSPSELSMSNPTFGRTLSGLAPVPARPPTAPLAQTGQQSVTLRPESPAKLELPSAAPGRTSAVERPSAEFVVDDEEEPQDENEASLRPRMYQPPSALEVNQLSARAARRPSLSLDDDSDATQIATIPRELLESLLSGGAVERGDRITERPPMVLEVLPVDDETSEGGELAEDEISELDLLLGREDNYAQRATAPSPPRPSVPRGLPPAPPQIAVHRSRLAPSPAPQHRPEHSMLSDLDALLPPVKAESEPAPVAPEKPRADRGAKAAQNTVTAKKPRAGYGALSSLDDSGKRARIELLKGLAEKKSGRAQGLLLTSAAELCEELQDSDHARQLYTRAHDAAPRLLAPVRALARLAFDARDFDTHVEWLSREASACDSHKGRAAALAAIARVRWLVQRDLPSALRAATEASRLCPEDIGYRVLEARLGLATRPAHAGRKLSALAELTDDDAMAGAWLTFAARAREGEGEPAVARQLYQSASERAPRSVDARLGLARVARAQGDAPGAAQALISALPALGVGVLADTMRRHAAVLLASSSENRKQALSLLDEASDPTSLRTAFTLANGAGDEAAEERATLVWMTHSEGQERALSLVTHAMQLSRASKGAGASDALEEALGIDRSLTLAKVLWDSLARDSGDLQGYLKRAGEMGGTSLLRGAAKVAFDHASIQAERELLSRPASEREASSLSVLRLDAQSEARDVEGVRAHFKQQVTGASDPDVSTLLTWADFSRRHADEAEALRSLRRAADLYPDNMLATRAFARATPDPDEIAHALLSESASARGPRAAFLGVTAGFLTRNRASRLAAFERAYEACPGHPASIFALQDEARKQNELARLAALHARESTRAKDPIEAVSHLLRAALVRAHDDDDAAAAQLARAHDLDPSDPVLRELVIRLGDAIPESLRAEAMQRIAERATAPFDRPAALAAAGSFEDASQPERALALYESVLRAHPEDRVAEMGRERVARAAGKTRELLDIKRRAVHEATTDDGRIRALEDLLHADADAPAEEALDRARALLVLSPDHQLALRRTERHAMERGDLAGLYEAELRLLTSSAGPKDRLSRLRALTLLASLRQRDRARADGLDRVLVDAADSAFGGPWLARQLMGAGIALAEPPVVLKALDLFASETDDPVELASLAVRRSLLELSDPPADRESMLKTQLAAYADHPTGAEALAELAVQRGDFKEAALQFTQAALRAKHRTRIARLWSRAGKLYQEQLSDLAHAKEAYRNAVEADVTFEDTEQRLNGLLSEHSDLAGLIALTAARLSAGVSADVAGKLRNQLAALYEKSGDLKLAVQTLRDSHNQSPDDLPTLRELARLLALDKDHRERAQVLLRIARLSREPVELRDVFMQLGDIYDHELPDAKRAEAAYQRALKLGPRHIPALERLAALYTREGQPQDAEATIERIVQLSDSEARRLEASFELARLKESRGDTRGAEETLESLRRDAAVQPEVLRALVEFYRRQGALSALAMHLNRATNDLREVVAQDIDHATAWITLVEMLEGKHRVDAARVAAATALACGVKHERLSKLLGDERDVPGVHGAGFSELLDDLVFSEDVPASTRIMFRYGAEALNKAVSFDLRAVGGEKLDRKHPLRAAVQEVGKWAGLHEVEVFTSAHLPLAFVPVSDSPPQLLIGKTLLETLTRPEQLFLTARALKIARACMSMTCRVRPDEMGLLIHGLIRSQMPGYVPAGVELPAVEEMGRRVAKHLNRRTLPELLPHLMELMGAPGFDPSQVYAVASTAGNRAALLVTGSVSAALSALTKLAGLPARTHFDNAMLAQVDEARDLLSFAVSDAHFEARLRAGVDLR